VGVPVAAASDNVRDWWHPYGDYDCLAVWREAVAMVGGAIYPYSSNSHVRYTPPG
jgi:hypothetical protein